MPKSEMNLTRLGWLLQSVAKEGADAFYNGSAEEIVKTVKKMLIKYMTITTQETDLCILTMFSNLNGLQLSARYYEHFINYKNHFNDVQILY